VRVPLLARLPGRIPKAKVVDGIGSTMDLLPTIAKLTGSPLPSQPLDGIDIWSLLSGKAPSIDREALLYFDNWHLQCARWKNWKLHVARYTSQVYSPAPAGGRVNLPLRPVELYNLALDPEESYDVADLHPEIVKEIQTRIDKLLPGFPEPVQKAWAETQARQTDRTPAGQFPRERRKA
jgi:arylsulfatase A-like enzyme